MKAFNNFVEETFGTGEAGKFKAAQAFGKAQKTIYNWCNSDKFWVYESDTEYKVIEVKAEMLR